MPEIDKGKTIIIANTTEPFAKQYARVLHLDSGQENIRHTRTLAQRAYLWEGDHKIVVTSLPIPQPLIGRDNLILGWRDVANLYPTDFSLSLSTDIMADRELWNQLTRVMRDNAGSRITAYSITAEFEALVEKLAAEGVVFRRSEDTRDTELIYYLDSKVGFRQVAEGLAKKHPELLIPEGYIAATKEEAITMAVEFYTNGRSCVIKNNKGASGWGTVILKKEDWANEQELKHKVEGIFAGDNIWDEGPYVVEELIKIDQTIAGGSPSTEVYIDDTGPRITYFCEQVINSLGEFLGVGIGKGAVPDWLRERIAAGVMVIANEYYRIGYRGFFDVDMVVGSDGRPYSVETNIRRTGGTHVFDLARNMWGEDQSNWGYLLSEDVFFYRGETVSAEEVMARTKRLLYPMADSNEGVVISMIDPINPMLGYIILGKDGVGTMAIQREFKRIWE